MAPIIANNENDEPPLSYFYYEALEHLLLSAMVENKGRYRKVIEGLKTESEALSLMDELRAALPEIGYHSVPKDVREAMRATRLRVERENFKEWLKTQRNPK